MLCLGSICAPPQSEPVPHLTLLPTFVLILHYIHCGSRSLDGNRPHCLSLASQGKAGF